MARSDVITPVLLVGGGGTRLWPLSTTARPKQFIPLVGERSLLRETLARLDPGPDSPAAFDPPVVIGSERQRRRIEAELAAAGTAAAELIFEPVGRNTAPAIAAAVLRQAALDDARLMLVLPSDHHIADRAAFHDAVGSGAEAARGGALVTFGIMPTAPETGYGYMRRGGPEGAGYRVERFVEKPSAEVARRFLAEGGYFWNAGIFLFTARAMAAALRRHAPDVLDGAARALDRAARSGRSIVLDPAAFSACPARSIDHAVMERHDAVVMIPATFDWSDVGTWTALHAAARPDALANVSRGRVLARDVHGSYLRADDGLVAAIGVANIAVVKAGASVLVTSLDQAQDVRAIEATIAALGDGGEWARQPPAAALAPAAARLRDWMFDAALPVWAERGWDDRRGGFREHLGRDGAPCAEETRRLRVQARQIYVFSAAHILGWSGPALDLARSGLDWLVRHGWQAEGGWAHLLTPEGDVADPARDLYDHAFVVFALAWLHRATGERAPLDWAARTLAYIHAALADPDHGGYRESIPDRLPRRANPHMHLLEALIALFDASRDFAWLDHAGSVVALFERTFFDAASGSVAEAFGADWAPAGGEVGRRREPGHQFEWAWLLHQYRIRLGKDLGDSAAALIRFAETFGLDGSLGLVRDAVDVDGRSPAPTHRLWAQMEAVRARAMLAAHGGDAGTVDGLLDRVFRHYLDPAERGLWIDAVDGAGRPLGGIVPASTLYHLMSATWELAAGAAAD